MRTAANNSQHSLPYGNLLQRILSANDINPPNDHELFELTNLCDELTTMGWVEKGINGVAYLVQMIDLLMIGSGRLIYYPTNTGT